jgi:ubiquinone/menaquinone biosynthesis C-methylase UbiE
MQEEQLKAVAQQLRRPEGEAGKQMGEIMNKTNEHINRYAIEQLRVAPGDTIMEIGMGNGFFVKEIVNAAPEVSYTGCDFSELMVEESLARNQLFVDSGQASFHLSTADQLPFKEASFDKIFTVNTLYFWEDTAKTLAEIRRVLKPGGTFLIAIRPKESMQRYPFVKWGFRMYSPEDVVALLEKGGFTVKEVFEKEEPAQLIDDQSITVETLIVTGEKNG